MGCKYSVKVNFSSSNLVEDHHYPAWQHSEIFGTWDMLGLVELVYDADSIKNK